MKLKLSLLAIGLMSWGVADAGTITLACEPDYPEGAFCEARVEGFTNPTPYSYDWDSTGRAYKPSPCSGDACQYGCIGVGTGGSAVVRIYDANSVLLGSASRSICGPN